MPFITKAKQQPKNGDLIEYICKVTRVHLTNSDKRVLFDMEVNGVSITGFALIEYTNKEDETKTMITFPQRQYQDPKTKQPAYTNIVFFPMSKEKREEIEKQVIAIMNEMASGTN